MRRFSILTTACLALVIAATAGCADNSEDADVSASKAAASAIAGAMRSSSPRVFRDATVSQECDEAMAAAANVPLSETNDVAMEAAVDPCSTADEFAQAIYAHPNAIGLTNLTDNDVLITLQAVCSSFHASGSPTGMCADLAGRGLSG